MISLILPFRYAIVEDGVMRGAHPTLKNYRFLRRLRLKTIISLTAEPSTPDLVDFCRAEGVNLVHRRAEKYDDGEVLSMSESLVADLLALLLDQANHPVFLHCRDGGHNTGLIIMCLRRLQHWTNEAIHDEHRRYTKGNDIHYQEEQFVESFPGPVRIPAVIPPWLWGGVRIRTHPSVKIIYAPGTTPAPHNPPSRAATAMQQYLQSLSSDDGPVTLTSPRGLTSRDSSAHYHRGFPPTSATRGSNSNTSDDFKAFTAAMSHFPSVSEDAPPVPRGGGGTRRFPLPVDDDGGGCCDLGVSAGMSDFFGGVRVASGRRVSPHGMQGEAGGSGDARDDYQGWPAMPSPGTYSVGTTGLALAALDLAAPELTVPSTRPGGRAGRPAGQAPRSAAIGGRNVRSGS